MDKPKLVIEDIPTSELITWYYDPTITPEEKAQIEARIIKGLEEMAAGPNTQRELRQIDLESSGLSRHTELNC